MKKITTKRRLPSFVRWILWVILVQLILINISAALYAYKLTHFYEDSTIRPPMKAQNIFVKTWRLFTGPRFIKSAIAEVPAFPFDTVSLKLDNGIFIDTWFAKTDSVSKGTVILFHGIASNKSKMIAEANDFRYQGYNIMMVDFRAHGNSGGNMTTIGSDEAEEVDLTYQFVLKTGEKNIFLYGVSMGAVAVMKAVAEYNLKPSGVILEMPFLSMQAHLQARARLLGFRGFPEKPFGFLVTGWIGIERGFNAYKYQATTYAQKINCPVLMQWGALDPVVLKKETNTIFNALTSARKKLVIYKGAGHESLLQNDPAEWRSEVEDFLMANAQ